MSQPTTDAARGRRPGLRGSPGGLLTAWLGSWLHGRVSSDDLLSAVQVHDEPHDVVGLPAEPGPVPLVWLLGHVRALGPSTVQLRMPVPGDVDGLSGEVLGVALDAREAVVVQPADHDRPGLILLPRRDVRGSALEPLERVTWQVAAWDDRSGYGPAAPTRLREAELGLADAVSEAVGVLVDIGQVSRLGPEAQEAIQSLRARGGPSLGLPPGSPPAAVRVLTSAERLAAVVDLATGEQPLSAVADRRRAQALCQVAAAVRQARRYAWTACAAAYDLDC